ncbi:MAG: hypothetical protein K2N07_02870, partial [Desulfovibrio sp.]|nr:hypothetical protein [Desulfovibrio sp.]
GVVNNNGAILLGMDGGQLLELANVRQVTTPKVKESSASKDEGEESKTEESKNEENKTDEGEKAENKDSEEQEPGSDENAEAKAA